jgi:hypothetical protein
MPKINLNMGQRKWVLSYKKGKDGFVELYEDKEGLGQVLLIQVEEDDNHLWATFFPANQEDPDWFFDIDDYEEHLQ